MLVGPPHVKRKEESPTRQVFPVHFQEQMNNDLKIIQAVSDANADPKVEHEYACSAQAHCQLMKAKEILCRQ